MPKTVSKPVCKPQSVLEEGYQLKAGQPAKSSNCADRRNLFIAGLLPNSETSEPELLSRLKLVAWKNYAIPYYTMMTRWNRLPRTTGTSSFTGTEPATN